MTRPYLQRALRSTAFYSVTLVYLAAVGIGIAVSEDMMRFDVGLVLLASVAVLSIVGSMRIEVGKVHTLVNSQHDVMVAKIGAMSLRIDELLGTLLAAGVKVPEDKAGVDRDRRRR